ncbi:hypothetical protein sr06412 [Sporisorium reilianum SRZ2]|uniref:Uncharacterized protein n=1 Tax=Sporisorium reilianum (strain SRZ2) TaxID=999809 RepID=E6ZLU1_SPORE|nr:hypothetical protein sr06412 [Sporisorium reilianum SRZ2]
MAEISRFSDSDEIAEDFEAMEIEQSEPETQSDAETSSSWSHDDRPNYFLRATICKQFIEYYQIEYHRLYPERCVEGTTDPWYGINCDEDRMDELFHRITCYVDSILDQRPNPGNPDKPYNFRVTTEILTDWMDILTQRSHHELKIAGYGGGCIISDDPWSGTYSLYKRLDDWVQQTSVELGLSESSSKPGNNRRPRADAGHEGDDDDEDWVSDRDSDSFNTDNISD